MSNGREGREAGAKVRYVTVGAIGATVGVTAATIADRNWLAALSLILGTLAGVVMATMMQDGAAANGEEDGDG